MIWTLNGTVVGANSDTAICVQTQTANIFSRLFTFGTARFAVEENEHLNIAAKITCKEEPTSKKMMEDPLMKMKFNDVVYESFFRLWHSSSVNLTLGTRAPSSLPTLTPEPLVPKVCKPPSMTHI